MCAVTAWLRISTSSLFSFPILACILGSPR
jgi:hypothetical protein